jgi:hypothetical protein
MKNKAKRFLLIGFAVFLAALQLSCTPETTTDTPALTSEQVISVIKVYGIPNTNYYSEPVGPKYIYDDVNPAGQWSAAYEGNGQWRIQGEVIVTYVLSATIQRKDVHCSTTWTYNEVANTITLAHSNCPKPITPTTQEPEAGKIIR